MFLTVLIWGTQPLAMKLVLRVFSIPFTACVRSLAAALLFGLLAARLRSTGNSVDNESLRLSKKEILWILAGGIGLGISNTSWNASLVYTTIGATSVLQLSSRVVLALYGIFILSERCTTLRGAAIALSLCGMFLVSWNGQDLGALRSSQYFRGNLFGLGAGLTWAICGIALKVTVRGRSGLSVVAPMFLLSALTTVVPALFGQRLLAPFSLPLFLLMLLTGILGLGLGNFLFAQSMRTIPASIAAAVLTVSPLISLACGAMFLHEPVTPYLLAGGPLTSFGVAAAFLSMARPKPSSASSPEEAAGAD